MTDYLKQSDVVWCAVLVIMATVASWWALNAGAFFCSYYWSHRCPLSSEKDLIYAHTAIYNG